MKDQTLYLIGYRCTGKSAVGRHLAYQLQWAYCDTDQLIKQNIDDTINAFFDEQGEDPFRDLEERMLEKASSLTEAVISTGGGVVERSDNREIMSERGTVVWLRAKPETIRARMRDDDETDADRPALSGDSATDEIEDVLDRRKDLYDDAADYSIATDDHPPESLAEFILDELQSVDE
jgi:shikimate kinase